MLAAPGAAVDAGVARTGCVEGATCGAEVAAVVPAVCARGARVGGLGSANTAGRGIKSQLNIGTTSMAAHAIAGTIQSLERARSRPLGLTGIRALLGDQRGRGALARRGNVNGFGLDGPRGLAG
jgi:hypothetical protein